MTQTTPQINTFVLLQFLTQYRQFENLAPVAATRAISVLFAKQDAHLAAHLVDAWVEKKGSFGDFYLNLEAEHKYTFLSHFGLQVEGVQEYLRILKVDPLVALFADKPPVLDHTTNLLRFFCNHSICPNPAPWLTLTLLPKSSAKCFGNSTNWANYILSLPYPEQHKMLRTIVENYNG